MQYAFVKFVLKPLIISESFDSIFKLAQDKELVGSSFCTYKSTITASWARAYLSSFWTISASPALSS